MRGKFYAGLAGLAAAAAVAAGPASAAAAAAQHLGAAAHGGQGRQAAVKSADAVPGVSSTVAPSWQTNATVWALAASGGVVYAGGDFTSVRPPGDPSGTGEVARTYLAAFSTSTGDLQSFGPTLDGSVKALAVSPDGKTLYVGGSFTHANGQYRDHLAAFTIATGALVTGWKPTAGSAVSALAPSPDGSAVYIGGTFGKLNGVTRTYAGAVSAATGALLSYAPSFDGSVTSVAVAPDGSRVLVGGYFATVNGVTQNGIASTDPGTGSSEPWAATILPRNGSCTSNVKDIIVNGSTAYIAAEGTGGGCFDGDFAANISDGALVWQNDCLGATQSVAIVGNWLYKGSHAHDCAFSPGGFPQVSNPSGGWITHHLLNQSLVDGSLGHWTPNTDNTNLGPRVMASDGSELFVGGSFTTVNGTGQQGFARFPALPDTTKPTSPAAPSVSSTSAGVASVTFTAVSDRDNGTLTYSVYRDSGTAPVGTVTAASWPWALPVLHFRDAGLAPGSSHTYRVAVSDGTNTTAKSPASAAVTVASTSPSLSYAQTVLSDSPSFFWRLADSGSVASDSSPHGFNGIYQAGTTQGVTGPVPGDPATATGFDGSTGLVTAASPVVGPQTFSIELWFKTTTNTGGKLAGFGNAQTGMSGNYDRHLYMMNDGQLVFGVWPGQAQTIETSRTYNDGQWHHAVATLSPTVGMALYVDNQLTGTNSANSAQAYTGYWRVGGDNLNGWNLDPWGSNSQGTTEPYGYYFAGSIGDVAVYPYALSATQVAAHYAANSLDH